MVFNLHEERFSVKAYHRKNLLEITFKSIIFDALENFLAKNAFIYKIYNKLLLNYLNLRYERCNTYDVTLFGTLTAFEGGCIVSTIYYFSVGSGTFGSHGLPLRCSRQRNR